MVKVETITQDTTITINPNSKSKTYEYGQEGISVTFDGGFTSDSGKDIFGYDENYFNFAEKNGNNLVLTTLFIKDNGKTKKVTTTIKGYFADDSKDYTFKCKSYNPPYNSYVTYPIKPDTAEGTVGLYGQTGVENDYSTNFFTGSNQKDTYDFFDNYRNYVYEIKGDDEYLSRHDDRTDNIVDLSGNDKYTINKGNTKAGSMHVYDHAGNDNYKADGNFTRLYTKDYKGNDKYELLEGSKFWLDDYKGNDEWTVTLNDSTSDNLNHRINDEKGNDKYHLTNATITIVDEGGKDNYEITNTSTLDISDSGKGNDTVDIKNCTNLKYGDFLIGNVKGNDTYTLDNVKFKYSSYTNAVQNGGYAINDENGNDKYNIKNSQSLILKDEEGNDKYTFDNCKDSDITDEKGNDNYTLNGGGFEVYINDLSGNDKYNLFAAKEDNNAFDSGIDDYAGKDTYIIKGLENEYINIVSIRDHSKTSKDKYNVSYTEAALINDSGGNDTYTFKKSSFQVDDNGKSNDSYTIDILDQKSNITYGIDDDGGKDTLTISSLNKNDIVFMTNYSKEGNHRDNSNSLIVYDSANNGYIRMGNFYKDENSDGIYEGYGDGRIETIKAGKKALSNIPTADHFTDSMREQVGAWLTQNDCSTVIGAIKKDVDISGLIQIFQG